MGKPAGAPFNTLGLQKSLVNQLEEKLQISTATHIQTEAIPALAHGPQTRDAIIQAQTGSGKTLAYLVPIVQRLLATPPETLETLDRSLGTLGIVLAPTRELAQQIFHVLERLANIAGERRWIVPGLLTGGEKRKSEKARLRKGVTLLVATPGRLLDHFETTQAFCTAQCRWVVLDEADKLLELGFQDKIERILALLRERSVLGTAAAVECSAWPSALRVVMCSATMHDKLQRLADLNMDRPQVLGATAQADGESTSGAMAVPTQLRQLYCTVPAKQRLVTLVALLRYLGEFWPESKCVVFFSCIDSVEFYYQLLTGGRALVDTAAKSGKSEETANNDDSTMADPAENPAPTEAKARKTPLREIAGLPVHFFPAPIFALHGSLPPLTRNETFKRFTSSTRGGILLTTDVSSRGLDLPAVDFIVQFDPPTDVREYVHRIGRTARVGARGVAVTFLLPEELQYAALLRERGLEMAELRSALDESSGSMGLDSPRDADGNGPAVIYQQHKALGRAPAADALEFLLGHTPSIAGGFGYLDAVSDPASAPPPAPRGRDPLFWEALATDVQMRLERLVEADPNNLADAGRRAFLSHVRAYATHSSAQRDVFHVRRLHLGHLAKAFALRETPSQIRDWQQQQRRSAKSGESGPSAGKSETPAARRSALTTANTFRPEDAFYRAAKRRTTLSQLADEFGSGLDSGVSLGGPFVPGKRVRRDVSHRRRR